MSGGLEEAAHRPLSAGGLRRGPPPSASLCKNSHPTTRKRASCLPPVLWTLHPNFHSNRKIWGGRTLLPRLPCLAEKKTPMGWSEGIHQAWWGSGGPETPVPSAQTEHTESIRTSLASEPLARGPLCTGQAGGLQSGPRQRLTLPSPPRPPSTAAPAPVPCPPHTCTVTTSLQKAIYSQTTLPVRLCWPDSEVERPSPPRGGGAPSGPAQCQHGLRGLRFCAQARAPLGTAGQGGGPVLERESEALRSAPTSHGPIKDGAAPATLVKARQPAFGVRRSETTQSVNSGKPQSP